MGTTTDSADPIIKIMAEGLKEGTRCQWQEIYFIGHSVVRYDSVLMKHELAGINWTDIYNTLTREFYKVFMTQAIVPPHQAMDPTKKLSGGWKLGTIYRGPDPSAVAYRPIGDTGFYQVSFVKFTRWKTGAVANMVKNLFYSQS